MSGHGRGAFEVVSSLEEVSIQLASGGPAPIDAIPVLPGGYLRARFGFRSLESAKGGGFTLPDLGLTWTITGEDDQGPRSVEGSSRGSDQHLGTLEVERFESRSGVGSARLRLPMLAVDPLGPPLFVGPNAVTCSVSAAGDDYSHRFETIDVASVQPPVSVVVGPARLYLGQDGWGAIRLAEAAEHERRFLLNLEVIGEVGGALSDGSINGLQCPSEVAVEPGALGAEFTLRYRLGAHGTSDSIVRIMATELGAGRSFSNPVVLETLTHLTIGRSPPIRGAQHDEFLWWEYERCRPAAVYNGPGFTRNWGCLLTGGISPLVPPDGPVILYRPGACLPYKPPYTCYKLEGRFQARIYQASTTSSPCTITMVNLGALSPKTATHKLPGLNYTTTFTATNNTILVGIPSCA
jgi:hypothetical protein